MWATNAFTNIPLARESLVHVALLLCDFASSATLSLCWRTGEAFAGGTAARFATITIRLEVTDASCWTSTASTGTRTRDLLTYLALAGDASVHVFFCHRRGASWATSGMLVGALHLFAGDTCHSETSHTPTFSNGHLSGGAADRSTDKLST